jgi:D-lactate dehydrogenase (cytochrome)
MSDLIPALRGIVGDAHVITSDFAPYANDWRKKYFGKPLVVVKPGTPEEIAAIVKLCSAAGVAIVPQAGNTSLVGGSVPDETGTELVLNVSRMNKVLEVDTINNTMTVEAGCILQTLQETATEHDRLFPLSLAAEGSCEIGGNISTNAGGVQVLRYGNTRELVMGLEVVLPSGEIWSGLKGLRKDNTGYDLKQLFIGAEGTLGIITKAVLKLFPAPKSVSTVFVALPSPRKALALLTHMRSHLGERLTAFELMSARCVNIVSSVFPAHRSPLTGDYAWYVLLEATDPQPGDALNAAMESALEAALEAELIEDAAIAKNQSEAGKLWDIREHLPEAQARNIKHDISVPISRIAEFIDNADAALEKSWPGVRPVTFGHLGDGNLHYNIAEPPSYTVEKWLEEWKKVSTVVHDCVHAHGGSISAEHGIGKLKNVEVRKYKSPVELALMQAIKHTLDPKNIMNPGKVV